MMEIIEDLPHDILGIAARGKLTEEDYAHILIPAAEQKLKEHGKIKMLFELGAMDGMELAALWEDTRFGVKHWRDFTHIALVTDIDWVKHAAAFFAPFVPGEVRMYGTHRESEAREWLVTAKHH